jgi:transposase
LVADRRLELFEAIRRDARQGESIRELAERHGVHRRTVRQAIDSAMPAPRKKPVRNSPRLDAVKPWIDEMLRVDLTAPRKQRHTVRRIVARLIDEHDAVGLPYTTVRDYVGPRRREITAEAGKDSEQGFILQTHQPGQEAEVDFGELYVLLAGVKTKVFLFALRMSYSGKSVHQVFASQGLEAFVEGHLHAFSVLGGVPAGKIRYDNLKPAVSRVLGGRSRTESDQWVWFRSHVGFEAFYCMPGMPPLADMISAAFSIAGSMVESPTVFAIRAALSSAMPCGSRTLAISLAILNGEDVAMSQPSDGRR